MTTEEGFIMMYVILGSPHDLGPASDDVMMM